MNSFSRGISKNSRPVRVVDLSEVEYYEDISRLVDGLWDSDCPYQFCGVTCNGNGFVQIARAFEEYPTVHLSFNKEFAHRFLQLDVSTYFYCPDPVNFPYSYESNLELYPHTIAAILTLVVERVFEATRADLKYDIEGDEVRIDGDDVIFVKNGAEAYADNTPVGVFQVKTLKKVLIFCIIIVAIVLLALL